MSFPVEPDFAVIKFGDGATPTEAFSVVCGMEDISINGSANLQDRFVRDCTAPNNAPFRKTKLTGKQWDVTASGLIDKTQLGAAHAKLGKLGNIKIELMVDDGTSGGALYATYAGNFRLGTVNVSVPQANAAALEMTLASEGDVTLTLA